MQDKDEINVTEMLISIKSDISRINAKLENMENSSNKADKALEKSVQNENDLSNLKSLYIRTVEVIGGGLLASILVYIFQSLF